MKLIVGLGNPGKEYEMTRHNAGFLVIDELVRQRNVGKRTLEKAFKAELLILDDGELNIEKFNEKLKTVKLKIIMCKPQTFMNLSGESVGKIAQFYKIAPQDILVIHDEIDFPFGKIEFKRGGSHAGHNGLRDIIAKLGTNDFVRVRVGVGRPADKSEVADYVLSKFTKREHEALIASVDQIEQMVVEFVKS